MPQTCSVCRETPPSSLAPRFLLNSTSIPQATCWLNLQGMSTSSPFLPPTLLPSWPKSPSFTWLLICGSLLHRWSFYFHPCCLIFLCSEPSSASHLIGNLSSLQYLQGPIRSYTTAASLNMSPIAVPLAFTSVSMLASLLFLTAHHIYFCLFALALSPHCHMAHFLPFFLSLIRGYLIRNTLSLHISLSQPLYSAFSMEFIFIWRTVGLLLNVLVLLLEYKLPTIWNDFLCADSYLPVMAVPRMWQDLSIYWMNE